MRISDWSSDVCSSDLERFAADRGRQAAKGEAGERLVAEMPPREVEQQRRGERPVNDEAAIALLLLRIGAVVMDAVAVEGQRRIAEQQGLRRADFAMRVPARGIEPPFAGRGRRHRRTKHGRTALRERGGRYGEI